MVSRLGEEIINIAFTPWIITPGITCAPSIISGNGWNFDIGLYHIDVEAPNAPPGIGLLSGQLRPRG